MIEVKQLESMAESLRVYDVAQDGWEGDPEGSNPKNVEANLTHISFHLSDVIERKNFSDFYTVHDEIAPDAMQYGLRLARWGKLSPESIVPVAKESEAYRTATTLGLHTLSESYFALASFIRASGVLARQLHDEDHRSSKEKALAKRGESLRSASALLVQCAVVQSKRGQFDLQEAFDTRLTSLRRRFGIPEPQEV